ncbi:MAG: exodeoxyribonuclease III, partial [Candidatus Omnitrophica bacterium]|nr:exodeoxyribonuclease III [Candidatus Omnitrophota bacterium]
MMRYKIISWNVNGLRAAEKKGFLDWFFREKPFALCVQETKAIPEQLTDSLREPQGYHSYFKSAERRGYSGVGVYSKKKPLKVRYGLGVEDFDREGRVIVLEYEHFVLYNIYFPNGKMNRSRLQFKLDFYELFLEKLRGVLKERTRKAIIACGDFNTAHTEIDLARPEESSLISGFLPEERTLIDKLINMGMVDTFRVFSKEGGHYTWWNLLTAARRRNVGWRIDYFFIDKKSLPNLKNAFIIDE